MAKSISNGNSKMIAVNLDTLEFELDGMIFKIPGSTVATVCDESGREIDSYGNRVYMESRWGTHRMSVRTIRSGKVLKFSGSPFAFKYGQNIFSASSVRRACSIAIMAAIRRFNICPPQQLLERWKKGDIVLRRVDLAVNFRLCSGMYVVDALAQMQRQLVGQYGTKKLCTTSVYWAPQDGKKYEVACYAKGPQLKQAKRYAQFPDRDRLLAEADNILRVEVRLRSSELRKLGLDRAGAWKEDTAAHVFMKYLSNLKLLSVTSGPLSRNELEKYPPRIRHVLALHKLGVNLEGIYEKHTLQRQRRYFRENGIDLRCPNQTDTCVISLPDLLTPENAISSPPKWMVEAGLIPVKRVTVVGNEKVQRCKAAKKKSKEVARKNSSKSDTSLRKSGK